MGPPAYRVGCAYTVKRILDFLRVKNNDRHSRILDRNHINLFFVLTNCVGRVHVEWGQDR